MTIFSKNVRGEITSYTCEENEEIYALLASNPVTKGHTLVVPKREVDYFFDLTDEEIGRMMVFSKRVAAAIKEVFPCKKVGVAVMGLDVPHAHVHLAPLQSEVDMDFGKKKLQLPAEEMMQIASQIQQAFERK